MELSHPSVVHISSSCSSSQLLIKSRVLLVPTPVNQIKHPLVSINQRNKFNPMEFSKPTICRASSLLTDHGSPIAANHSVDAVRDRIGSVKRVTNEWNVEVELNLDGVGSPDSSTGIPFLDHMLDALLSALGDRKGINRFGDLTAPLDEALVHVSVAKEGLIATFSGEIPADFRPNQHPQHTHLTLQAYRE